MEDYVKCTANSTRQHRHLVEKGGFVSRLITTGLNNGNNGKSEFTGMFTAWLRALCQPVLAVVSRHQMIASKSQRTTGLKQSVI